MSSCFGELQERTFTYSMPVRLGSLPTAEVAKSPGRISEHAQLPTVPEERKQRLQSPSRQNVITALRAVARNVSQSPHGLLSDVGFMAPQELDEDRHRARFNDNLGLLSRTRGDVRQGPGGLELNQGVRVAQELHEATNNAGFDDLLDGWVAFFRQQLAELGRGLNLSVDLVGEDSLDHLRKFFVELSHRDHAVSWAQHTSRSEKQRSKSRWDFERA